MTSRAPRQPKVRQETIDLARRRARAAGALHTGSDTPPDQQVALLKVVCRRLWTLLDQRHPTIARDVDRHLSPEARAAIDRTFEAAMALWAGSGIHVEPCRRITDDQLAGGYRYLLIYRSGERRVVSEDRLLMMAGV